jgi:hypothetical protein
MRTLKQALLGTIVVAALAALVGCTSGSGESDEPFEATDSPSPTATSPTPTDTSTPAPTMTSPSP